jgi:hypothetical protein
MPQGPIVLKEIAMRIATSILLGLLLPIGAVPFACAQPVPPDGGTQTAANAGLRGPRDTYIQKSEEELDDWQARLLRFDAETKAGARKDGAASWADLMAALDGAEAGAYKLQTVTADGLDDAKASYEKAISELADTWEKARPDDRRQ